MNIASRIRAGSFVRPIHALYLGLALQCFLTPRANADGKNEPSIVQVKLTEWKVSLTPKAVPPGPVVLQVTNSGKIPHALEIEGRAVEKSTPQIVPGATATMTVDLAAGTYETYCPVGKGSHKMLGMVSRLSVAGPDHAAMHGAMHGAAADGEVRRMTIVGGGPVVQILPGPYPFADSAMTVIRTRPPDQVADLTKKAHMGPYSNNVAIITGAMTLAAVDRGASGDSVSGVADFTAEDGARWKVVMDRVQTKDIPFNPRFGGVIMGLFYHGASGVHTPLVPTIQSSVALWAIAHLYKDGRLVTDDAMVHVMLLSRTRRTTDWALDCWDCSDRPVEELQLQVTSAPGTPPFDAPGGFLFVNWEKSIGRAESM